MTPRSFLTASLPASLLAALLLCSGTACQSAPPPQWVDTQVPCNSESLVYEVLHLSLQKAGYPIGIGADRGARTIETGWYVSGSPFKGKGYRQRAHVQYKPVSEGNYGVSIRVERQTNESLRPLDPRFAKWEPTADNTKESDRILQYIRSFLAGKDINVGPTPLKRYR